MFHFRQFSVEDKQTAMKVGTDAVLLGSWIQPGNPGSILDVGTGCGIIALMMAQRTKAIIDAVEIDKKATEEAIENVKISPWPARIKIYHSSFQDFTEKTSNKYDLVISNPPFFENSLKSPDSKRNLSRHNDLLPVAELIEGAAGCLKDDGILSVIVPASQEHHWITEAKCKGLLIKRSSLVYPRAGKPAARIMIEFSPVVAGAVLKEELYIRDSEGKYTEAYINLTRDFYLGL
jgi:tRNA1Val (adenine37-N6)-methyltransferase